MTMAAVNDTADLRVMIADTAERIFRDHCPKEVVDAAERGEWPEKLWSALEENGLTLAGISERAGGARGLVGDSFEVLKVAGRYAAPLPLAETFLAGLLFDSAGLAVPEGPLTVAPVRRGETPRLRRTASGHVLGGRLSRVPWGRRAARLGLLARAGESGRRVVAIVDPMAATVAEGANLAGEPRDTLVFEEVSVPDADVAPAGEGMDERRLFALGALARAVLMAGALERLLEMTVQYATDRIQFGRPIAKFQAIQHNLAIVAGAVAAAGKASELAVRRLEAGGDAWLPIAIAKARVGEAAGLASSLCHQVHGAIGYTYEYPLHQRTRRLWSWRDEFGSESYWQNEIGRHVAKAGADNLWPLVTAM